MAWSSQIHDEIENMFACMQVFDQDALLTKHQSGFHVQNYDGGMQITDEEMTALRSAASKKAVLHENHPFGKVPAEVLRARGIKSRGYTEETWKKHCATVVLLYMRGVPVAEIRRRVGGMYGTIKRILADAGVEYRPMSRSESGKLGAARQKKMLEESNV